MSEHEKQTINEDPDLLTDEELDAVAGGIGDPSMGLRQHRRPSLSPVAGPLAERAKRGIIDDNN
jgi:hypothetical protein